jgi:short-subunit dehydrogenase
MESLKLVVVTGSNKGIGYGIVENLIQKAFRVVMACRNVSLAEQARTEILTKYNVDPSRLEVMELDIGNSTSIDKFVTNFAAKGIKADVLVNNAATAFKGDAFDDNVVTETFRPNVFGTIEISEKFLPLLNPFGKIVTLGSRAGLITRVTN